MGRTSRARTIPALGLSSLPLHAFSYSRTSLSFVQYAAPVEVESIARWLDSIYHQLNPDSTPDDIPDLYPPRLSDSMVPLVSLSDK